MDFGQEPSFSWDCLYSVLVSLASMSSQLLRREAKLLTIESKLSLL